jgi:hypothetical protein
MAGNITATMVGRDLVIEGDDLANTLAISQDTPNTVILRGFAPDERFAQTTINGINTSFNPVRFELVTGSIVVRMRGADDRLFLTGGRFQGPLNVDLGIGQDTYQQDGARIEQNQTLDGGLGNDTITLRSSSVGESLSISGSAGFDAIFIQLTAVGQFTGILGGGEGDRIEAIHSAFAAGVSILGGAGGDLVDLTGCRFDTTLFVALEADIGATTVQGCIIQSNCWLTAEGRAHIRFLSSRAGRLEIFTGPSHDTVVVDRSALDMLFVLLGQGDDQLRVTGNQVARGGLFDGQGGFDTLFERVFTVGAQRLGFEFVDIM